MGFIWISLGETAAHLPTTRVAAKSPAPNRFPTAVYKPSDSPDVAREDKISGAPFANANKVTPEMLSLRRRDLETLVRTGVK